jgi:hypothetical protein
MPIMFEMIPEDAVYFPSEAFGSERTTDFFTKFLRAMGEPPLQDRRAEGLIVLRFLWLRTFHRPICVRAEGPVPGKLVVTRTLGMGGYRPGVVDQKWARDLTVDDWGSVESIVLDRSVWSGHQEEPWGVDGAVWILEASIESEHRVAAFWCPREEGRSAALRSACMKLIDLAGIEIVEGDIY